MIAVTFHKDGTHEIVRSENGISFLTENLVNFNVMRVYFAKSEADAKAAIQALKTTAQRSDYAGIF